jgi:hypothetical protein
MLIISFHIKGIVHKEFVLADQTVDSAYCCDVLRRLSVNVRRLRPEFWLQKNCQLHDDKAPSHTSIFTGEFLTKNNMTMVPHPPYFSLEVKLTGRHFDPTGVIGGAEILTEHEFQDETNKKKQTPRPESASELYRPSDRRLSAKLVPTFADRGCRVVSTTDPYGHILCFLDRRIPRCV